MIRMSAIRQTVARPLRHIALSALVALPMGLAAQAPAEARDASFRLELHTPQGSYSVGDRGRRGQYREYRHAVLPPHKVVRRLRRQGFFEPRGLTFVPQRQVYRVDAYTHRGQPVRLRVDARTGEALRVRYLDDHRRGGRRDGRRGRRR